MSQARLGQEEETRTAEIQLVAMTQAMSRQEAGFVVFPPGKGKQIEGTRIDQTDWDSGLAATRTKEISLGHLASFKDPLRPGKIHHLRVMHFFLKVLFVSKIVFLIEM